MIKQQYPSGDCVGELEGYYCKCTNDWMGWRCDHRKDGCELGHMCSSGSTCIPLPNYKYRCICQKGNINI